MKTYLLKIVSKDDGKENEEFLVDAESAPKAIEILVKRVSCYKLVKADWLVDAKTLGLVSANGSYDKYDEFGKFSSSVNVYAEDVKTADARKNEKTYCVEFPELADTSRYVPQILNMDDEIYVSASSMEEAVVKAISNAIGDHYDRKAFMKNNCIKHLREEKALSGKVLHYFEISAPCHENLTAKVYES